MRIALDAMGSDRAPAIEVEGATGYYDPNYEGKRDACLTSLADRDFFVIHIEASDEAGHNGEVDAKVEALENWDRRVIGPLVEALDRMAKRNPATLLGLE
jgi:2,3-bisphosphoglycerate-independent phosphoglycerate mutase